MNDAVSLAAAGVVSLAAAGGVSLVAAAAADVVKDGKEDKEWKDEKKDVTWWSIYEENVRNNAVHYVVQAVMTKRSHSRRNFLRTLVNDRLPPHVLARRYLFDTGEQGVEIEAMSAAASLAFGPQAHHAIIAFLSLIDQSCFLLHTGKHKRFCRCGSKVCTNPKAKTLANRTLHAITTRCIIDALMHRGLSRHLLSPCNILISAVQAPSAAHALLDLDASSEMDFNKQTWYGLTALQFSVQCPASSISVLKRLLERSSDVTLNGRHEIDDAGKQEHMWHPLLLAISHAGENSRRLPNRGYQKVMTLLSMAADDGTGLDIRHVRTRTGMSAADYADSFVGAEYQLITNEIHAAMYRVGDYRARFHGVLHVAISKELSSVLDLLRIVSQYVLAA